MAQIKEQEEQRHLDETIALLQTTIKETEDYLINASKDLKDSKTYLYDNKDGMDRMEKEAMKYSITQNAIIGETVAEKRKRLQKLLQKPYFGRFDFKLSNQEAQIIYVGIHSFFDNNTQKNIIFDWRAPIASMYYDYNIGKAQYESPTGSIKGNIVLKRQFQIKDGKINMMIENSSHVFDNILQEELGKSTDEKMKNIVATIQQDQNQIIRNVKAEHLIIQGVAGSGKTSIALHRIAFLLYQFKNKIKAQEILIISPNKVFADYISNVLPELGEEMIPSMGMEDIALELLDAKYKFQTYYEQVHELISSKDKELPYRISYKSDIAFIRKLEQYITHIQNDYYLPQDFWIKRYIVPAWFLKEKFDSYHRLPLFKRFNEIAKDVEANINIYYKYEVNADERAEIKKTVISFFKINNLRELYKDLFIYLDLPHLLKSAQRGIFEYNDIFPFIYLKMRLEGIKTYNKVKHLVIDEMQDYSPVQYVVLSKAFNCPKTILGDFCQSINQHIHFSVASLSEIFNNTETVYLNKSYRSTYEITAFAQKIIKNPALEAIERHGPAPFLHGFNTEKEEINNLEKIISQFLKGSYKSMCILCKTTSEAEKIKEKWGDIFPQLYILSPETLAFSEGLIVSTIPLAKGLEFDEVIIPFATQRNYKTVLDKSLLYIGVTRAMHKLHISYSGEPTDFIV